MLHAVRRLGGSGSLRPCVQAGARQQFYSHQAEAHSKQYYEIPEGHQHSDLSNLACNISLTRRKDLTMRQDITLAVGGQNYSLMDLLRVSGCNCWPRAGGAARTPNPTTPALPQGHRTVLFGVPDRGSVCSEQQVPGYVREAGRLRQLGISKVLCVTVGTPVEAEVWAKQLNVDPSQVEVAADTNQALTRFLGMELAPVGQPGPNSMRWSALVDDGILLKVVRVATSGCCCAIRCLLLLWDGGARPVLSKRPHG